MSNLFLAFIKHPISITKGALKISWAIIKDQREIDRGMKLCSKHTYEGDAGRAFEKKLDELTQEYKNKIKAVFPHRTMVTNYATARMAAWMELDEDAAVGYWNLIQDKIK